MQNEGIETKSKYTLTRALNDMSLKTGNYGVIKFVRFSDGAYVFGCMSEQHSYIAGGLGDPVSAGFLRCGRGKFVVTDAESFSLGLGPCDFARSELPPVATKLFEIIRETK
jgi:hypothetical protein